MAGRQPAGVSSEQAPCRWWKIRNKWRLPAPGWGKTAAVGGCQHLPGRPPGSLKLSTACPFAQVLERRIISYTGRCWVCCCAKLFILTGGSLQLQRKVTSLEEPLEPKKKLVSNLGLHVTPTRDSITSTPPFSSSSTLALETLIVGPYHLLHKEMEQLQGS